jgi:hypothetical protein
MPKTLSPEMVRVAETRLRQLAGHLGRSRVEMLYETLVTHFGRDLPTMTDRVAQVPNRWRVEGIDVIFTDRDEAAGAAHYMGGSARVIGIIDVVA